MKPRSWPRHTARKQSLFARVSAPGMASPVMFEQLLGTFGRSLIEGPALVAFVAQVGGGGRKQRSFLPPPDPGKVGPLPPLLGSSETCYLRVVEEG